MAPIREVLSRTCTPPLAAPGTEVAAATAAAAAAAAEMEEVTGDGHREDTGEAVVAAAADKRAATPQPEGGDTEGLDEELDEVPAPPQSEEPEPPPPSSFSTEKFKAFGDSLGAVAAARCSAYAAAYSGYMAAALRGTIPG